MSKAAATASGEAKKDKPVRTKIQRPSSDATRWHMSKDAVDRGMAEIARWTDLECIKHMAAIRWGSFKHQTCPHCLSADDHYWSKTEKRWKCRGCGSRFSVTSKTDRKSVV